MNTRKVIMIVLSATVCAIHANPPDPDPYRNTVEKLKTICTQKGFVLKLGTALAEEFKATQENNLQSSELSPFAEHDIQD